MVHRRSELSVPASNWKMIEKALASDADIAFLDLEDSVAPSEKPPARRNVVRAMRELDWRGKPRAFRVNGLGTPHFYRDIVEVFDDVQGNIDFVILPKAESTTDIAKISTVLRKLETEAGLEQKLGIEVQIESAKGLLNAAAIAAANPRINAITFGPGDYSASVGMPSVSIGARDEWDEAYGADRWHFAMQTVLVAGRAAGVSVIDGPFADFRDAEGFRTSCRRARSLGFDGKWCIHPGQIAVANEVFSPTVEEITWATDVVSAYETAKRKGEGAVAVGNTMIDAASVRMAKRIVEDTAG
ncbi:MAG: HpcH/HpaI aldolase/citrate lyase family protein [Thermomicrobiales bacterium]